MLTTLLRIRLSRLCLTLALCAALWASVIAVTGGFGFETSHIRFSSREPRRVAVLALLSGGLAWMLAPRGRRWHTLYASWEGLTARAAAGLDLLGLRSPRVADGAAALTTVLVILLGILKGSTAAGGSDSYGYVSEAHLFATGTVREVQPIMRLVTWPFGPQALAPLGYLPAGESAIVPQYPPGLPLVMAAFERVLGPHAVFYVVPLFGGLAIWATYMMGARLAGREVGLVAAILLAASPVFLFQLMSPMSDVPATAWWTLSLALLGFRSRTSALGAGLAAGAAILTRPNLAPLLAAPLGYLVWLFFSKRTARDQVVHRVVLLAAGVVPACLAIAGFNTLWYGSPLNTGRPALDYIYGWGNLGPNLLRYPRWLLETQTPIVLLAVAAPFVLARTARHATGVNEPRAIAITYFGFIIGTFGSYVFFFPFDAWWYLRYLLPAIPALLVLTSVVVIGVSRRLPAVRGITVATLIGMIASYGIHYARQNAAFDIREGERKYSAVGDYIARRFPERAVFLAMQHGGSVRYYSGRLTVRWDLVPPAELDPVVADLQRLGYHPYFVLEDWEEEAFRRTFQTHSRLAALDWPPVATLQHPGAVKIYDAAPEPAAAGAPPLITEIIH
jgi:hypothetical protein